MVREVQGTVTSIKYFVQLTPGGIKQDFLEGCLNFEEYFAPAVLETLKQDNSLIESLRQDYYELDTRDAHIIIYHRSTGEPKPALSAMKTPSSTMQYFRAKLVYTELIIVI